MKSKTRNRVIVGVVIAVLVLGGIGYFVYKKWKGGELNTAPTSFHAALTTIEDIPPEMFVISPPTSHTRLGRRVLREESSARTGEIDVEDCYLVFDPTVARSFKKMSINFTSKDALKGELRNVVATADFKSRESVEATLEIEGMELMEGAGIPIPNTPCWGSTETVSIVTRVVRAKRISVNFKGNLKMTASGKSSLGKTKATLGWSAERAAEGFLEGEDITLLARSKRVDKEFTEIESTNLGTTVEPTIIRFPPGFAGQLTVVKYDNSGGEGHIGVLRVRAEAPLSKAMDSASAPSGVRLCPVGEEIDMALGELCLFASRSIAISVTWRKRKIDGADHIVVDVSGYKTIDAPEPVEPDQELE